MARPEGNAAKRVASTSPPPWWSWSKRMSRHGRAIRFIETYCRPAKGIGHGQPLKLAGFQKSFLEETLRDGIDVGVMQMPRGQGKALAIEANGSLLGMHVDELLRGTVGDNIFGKSSSYRVVVDGKVDARSIRLTAKGVSAAELRESIAGATTVSGSVRAAMASGAQSFAQFATGIGSIFSNTSAFDSAVLGAFINRENTVAGGVALGGGTVNLKDVTVQGGNTTAVINGSNRMAEGTTNTTIRLNTGNKGYVATMTGKLASPDLHAVGQ